MDGEEAISTCSASLMVTLAFRLKDFFVIHVVCGNFTGTPHQFYTLLVYHSDKIPAQRQVSQAKKGFKLYSSLQKWY